MSSHKPKQSRGLRLDAYLARAGLASRKEARGLIRKKAVRVDGEICRDADRRILDERVTLYGVLVESPASQTDFVLNKPVGLSCSHDDRESPLVFGLLDEQLSRRGLEIAGRLDRATSGLVILSTDGDFVHQLTHPTRKVPKRYRIGFTGTLVENAVERCVEGIVLGGKDRPTRPAELTLLGRDQAGLREAAMVETGEGGEELTLATLVLREGRTHQVRRMIRALGGEVVTLQRDRIGRFDLPSELEPGELRPLEPGERPLLLSDNSL